VYLLNNWDFIYIFNFKDIYFTYTI
jgi:hypothetical protein